MFRLRSVFASVFKTLHFKCNMSGREFTNPYHEYQGDDLLNEHGQINDDFGKKLHEEVERQMERLKAGLQREADPRDYSVYTGSTGIALLHLHMYNAIDKGSQERHLLSALEMIERPLRHLKHRKVTFMCGDAGPLATAAVIYDKLGKNEEKNDCLKRLIKRQREVIEESDLPDEFLFGRVGYLYALLFVQQHLGESAIDQAIIDKVYEKIIESGQDLSKKQRHISPLMYEWHGKKYLGAAHGLVGILYTLMQVKDPRYKGYQDTLIKPSLDYLMTLRFPSGNYPSSISSTNGDRLVHWCHGAPGWIHLFATAYRAFGDDKYLMEAKSCGEVIWKRGLLRKGYGICHGVAGNAYGFLTLYNLTQDLKYLHRAIKFAEWCFDYGKHGCPSPDRPYSLFEGLAGTIYFLVDLLHPSKAKFPAFEL